MDREIFLLLVGALIGFIGSTFSAIVSFVLEGIRTRRQWQRDDALRVETARREEIKLAQDFNMKANLDRPHVVLREPKGEYCFLSGTQILLSSGRSKPIEKIKIGDKLLSYKENSGEKIFTTVSQIRSETENRYAIINKIIRVTHSHLLYTERGWKRVNEISLRDSIFNAKGDYVPVFMIETVEEASNVFNIDTENDLPFFAEKFLVGTHVTKNIYRTSSSVEDLEEVVEIDESGHILN